MQDLSLCLIQSDLYWENKAKNLTLFEQKIQNAPDSDLIILPEMFTTGFSMAPSNFAEKMDGPSVHWLKSMAKKKDSCIIGSLIIEEDGKYFNRLVAMQKNGEYVFYDKRHLFSLAGEEKQYQAGNKKTQLFLKGWSIDLFICYDLRFPVWCRNKKADLMIFVANWPAKRQEAWKSLLLARSIENQCYVAGLNRYGNDGNGFYHSGNSSVHDPEGKAIASINDCEDIIQCTLSKSFLENTRKKFPFHLDADSFKLYEE